MSEAPEKIWAIPNVNPSRGYGVWYLDQQFNHGTASQDQVKYRRADLPPKVKALVWDGKRSSVASTIYGSYYVERQAHEYVCFFIPPTATKRERHWELLGSTETEDDGRATCWEEHKKRVQCLLE